MIRVSQQMLFTNYVSNMNSSLSQYMDLNMQAASQKRINKGSDDPAGIYQVYNHRETLSSIDQYRSNIGTAQGWLKQADDTILQMNTIVTRLKELAEQGSTGHLTDDNREQISYEVREMYNQLITLANQRFEGKSIFAGHKTEESAFEAAMWMRGNDNADLNGVDFKVEGDAPKTVVIQMLDGDGVTPLALGDLFRYSTDGGKTFSAPTAVVPDANGDFLLDMGGVRVTIDAATPPQFTAVSATDTNDTSGSWMWVYPTAQYMGDDKDAIEVDEFGAGGITGSASGVFNKNTLVRVDGYNGTDTITYSYSTDGGSTWKQNNTAPAQPTDTTAMMTVPGGTLTLTMPTDVNTDVATGQQFSIRPRTADISVDISQNESVVINGIGKDIFGGIYQDPSAAAPSLVFGNDRDKNLFDTVGRLLSSLETNNQDGCQDALEHLRTSSEHLLNQVASYAGRENRLVVAKSVLTNLEYNEEERLSAVEDVDVTELMTKLAQQQIGYEAVLKSSSSIMKMSLMNFI
ncbi:flagellar hook-associated protein FlgL [Desulfocurvibacter africanus]|uniref:flagellar hook-associated protein FlgL n=1 Tax=Desulfocurvibacter africanus TaxID=873 RepID=UPI0003F6EF1E|nr:flagellar hook-associated protein FlgL [Desulfocurvibacter africanus]